MKPNTKITRHVPLNDGYDECIVLGPNPVSSPTLGEWPSSGGASVVVQPVQFGENKAMPLDYIAQNFEITAPVVVVPDPREVTPTYSEQPSPNQAFAAAAALREEEPVAVVAKPAPKPLSKDEVAAKRAAAKAGKA